MTSQEIANLIDFFDSSLIWFPLYAVAFLFVCNAWLGTYNALEDAQKEIKILRLEKRMLNTEINNLHLKL
jgi:hypothetical protein